MVEGWPSPPTHGHLGQVWGALGRFRQICQLREIIALNNHCAPAERPREKFIKGYGRDENEVWQSL